MAAECGVASADEDILSSGLTGDLVDHRGDLVVSLRGLLCREASGIGHDIEKIVLLIESAEDAVVVPSCINRDVVNGLHAGRVIIEDNDLLVVLLDLSRQQRVGLRFVNLLVGIKNFSTDRHSSLLSYYSGLFTSTSASFSKY